MEKIPSPEKHSAEKILLLENGQENIYDKAEFLKQREVDNWVRLSSAEFDDIDPERPLIDYFNLKTTNSVVGKKYIFMRILRNGVRAFDAHGEPDPKNDKLPLLSLDGAFIVKCLGVQTKLPYDALTDSYFEHSLKGIKDTESLKAKIYERYKESREDLTLDDVVRDGVAHTLFEVVERQLK